jgi:hypothetical protein
MRGAFLEQHLNDEISSLTRRSHRAARRALKGLKMS